MATGKERKQRGPPLRRGKACLNCRQLKIKCDGARPVCGQCTRVPKEDQCEYNDTMSRTQELEYTVHRLQSRLNELQQNRAGPSKHSSLSHIVGFPGASSIHSARSSPFSESSSSDISPTFATFMSESQSSPSSENSLQSSQLRKRREEEPPFAMVHVLLQFFLPHATQFGFFLHPQRFHDSALLPYPVGDERRPSPALLYVVYLWGAHLSQDPSLRASETVFLKRAKQYISTQISTHNHPTHLLHTVQAQVLLSTYSLSSKRPLEAEFHANGAATLVLSYHLHKIRSSRPTTPPLLGVPVLVEVHPAPLHLNTSIDAASASFCILESLGAGIDTPWPLEIHDYEAGALPPGYHGQESIRHFLTEDNFADASPISTLHAKASVLLYRATRLGSSWSPNLRPQELAAYQTSYTWLDRRIAAFWQSLPPIYAFFDDTAAVRTLALSHALTAAAAIRLHRSPAATDTEAQAKCLFAARAVLDALGDQGSQAQAIAHPVVGALCALACRVLMDEKQMQKVRAQAWAVGLGPSAEELRLLEELRAGMGTMGVYATGCALIVRIHVLSPSAEANSGTSTRLPLSTNVVKTSIL
ncbi:Zn(2)-C6 fungal-type domain-containing protein [Mycena venus]|uniref:Zn(2)-C6 fungal-type domain-containing protein n=1 Tax=Mycena venus TaxID=2733690 RepID=A0A8H6U1N7_9AGAR|nr:Zn(2)-C6 fungal-type domain-containing protein [Mycena venus]